MGPRSSEPKFVCTSSMCRKKITSSFEAFLHPLLKCLVCRKCHTDYKTGDFSLFEDGVDENGDDNYCRWCVDGGNLFTCGNADQPDSDGKKCHYSFCTDCIKHNCPDDEVLMSDQQERKDWKWNCFACDPTRLESLRKAAQDAIIYLSQKELKKTAPVASDKATPAKETEVTSTKTGSVDSEEVGSATKKRKTDNAPTPESNKDVGPNQATEVPKDRERDKNKEREKEKEKAKDKGKEKEKEKDKDKEKGRDKDKDNDSIREPESVNRPHIEPVKPVSSTLRNLKNPVSSIPKPQATTPNSTQQPVFLTTDKNLTKVSSNPNETPRSKPVTNAVHLHPRPGLSKQLKSSTETITPTTRIHLSDQDLKNRLEAFGKIKDRCVKEINTKFESIFEMFTNKEFENNALLKGEIEDCEHAVEDFKRILISMRSLQSSQRI